MDGVCCNVWDDELFGIVLLLLLVLLVLVLFNDDDNCGCWSGGDEDDCVLNEDIF